MHWSKINLKTLRQAPSGSTLISDQLLSRGAYIKKLSSGIFVYGPFLLRAIKKLEAIIREEIKKTSYEEILMPMVQPKSLWKESGRWNLYNHLLQKFKSRVGGDFCLGPTHEEVVTKYAKDYVSSYKDFPLRFFQIQNKYRDEIRPRFALLRAREFIMKDAYSFDKDEEEAKKSYNEMHRVYTNIFKKIGLAFRVVRADSGEIGGELSHEFHILSENGEDELLVSKNYAVNKEACPCRVEDFKKWSSFKDTPMPSLIFTPGLKTLNQLSKVPAIKIKHLVKTLLLKALPLAKESAPKIFAILLKAEDEINFLKLKKNLRLSDIPELLTAREVKEISSVEAGYIGPMGLGCDIYLDASLGDLDFFITGANKEKHHLQYVVPGRDFSYKDVMDFRYAKDGDLSPEKEKLRLIRGIEVGHIFYLGKKYAKLMGLSFLDKQGRTQYACTGCYGIGVTRTVQATIESSHDAEGIIWPISLAPFLVHVCLLDREDRRAKSFMENFCRTMKKNKIEYFVDDRGGISPGVKFKDADLLGFPLRVTVGSKDLSKGQVEVVERRGKKKHKIKMEEVSSFLGSYV